MFDFDTERDPCSIAQGALLLSYYSTNSERLINSFWLSLAIQYARAGNAQMYHKDQTLSEYAKGMKKRLWWCCILRDRILPLGLRRPLQITRSHFDFECCVFTEEDLNDETDRSDVYNAATKRLLAKIFVAQCELATKLTDVITIVYPLDGSSPVTFQSREEGAATRAKLEQCKSTLNEWFDEFDGRISSRRCPERSHPSVALYTNLVCIYYQCVLCRTAQEPD